MQKEQKDLERELIVAKARIKELELNINYIIDTTPGAVRCHEGGGPENLVGSLAITWGRLMHENRALTEAIRSGASLDALKRIIGPSEKQKETAKKRQAMIEELWNRCNEAHGPDTAQWPACDREAYARLMNAQLDFEDSFR